MFLVWLALFFGALLVIVGGLGVWVSVSDYFETPEEDRTGFFESQS
jgi:hypothetical protein